MRLTGGKRVWSVSTAVPCYFSRELVLEIIDAQLPVIARKQNSLPKYWPGLV